MRRSKPQESPVYEPEPEQVDQEDEEEDDRGDTSEVGGKAKKAKLLNTVVNEEGIEMYELGSKRFISLSEFKGKTLVNIREYYEKDGKLMPGKKGISLTQEQYRNLKKAFKIIDEKLVE